MMTAITRLNDSLLRHALRGNSAFSGFSGALFILLAAQIAALLGVSPAAEILIAALGAGLLAYAAFLYWASRQPQISPQIGLAAVIADALWVVSSLVILALDPFSFSTAGRWAVLIVADVVAVFAILQFVGLRRL